MPKATTTKEIKKKHEITSICKLSHKQIFIKGIAVPIYHPKLSIIFVVANMSLHMRDN